MSPRNRKLIGWAIVLGLGPAAWLTYVNAPISIYSLGSGAVFLGLRPIGKAGSGSQPASFGERLATGLATATRKVALWLHVGFTLVWLAQIVINLFRSRVDPNQVLAAELRLYEVSEGLTHYAGLSTAVACLAVALLLAALLSALWPLTVVSKLRKYAGAATIAFAAITSFSFVTVGNAADRLDFYTGPIRAEIADNLRRLAGARQQRAALQWMAAELSRATASSPQAIRDWHDYFDAAERACRADRLAESRAASAALAPLGPAADDGAAGRDDCSADWHVRDVAKRRGPYVSGAVAMHDRYWLAEYVRYLRPLERDMTGETYAYQLEDLSVGGEIRQPEDLRSLRDATAHAATEAETARDTIRGVAVSAIASLLPETARGVAGEVVDAWTGGLLRALADESAERVGQRVRALDVAVPHFLRAPAALAVFQAVVSPVEPPGVARERQGSLENVVRADVQGANAEAYAAAHPVTTRSSSSTTTAGSHATSSSGYRSRGRVGRR